MKTKRTRLNFSRKDLELRRLGQVTLRELATRYGVSQTTVWNVLCCFGLAGQRPRVCRTTGQMRQLVLEGAARGWSLRQIAREVGLSHEQVRQILARKRTTSPPVRRCHRCGRSATETASAATSRHNLCMSCLLRQSDYPLSERLRALRLARNWTQHELAEASGVSSSTIFHMESSGHEPGLRIIRKLAAALEVKLFTLIGGSPSDEPAKAGATAILVTAAAPTRSVKVGHHPLSRDCKENGPPKPRRDLDPTECGAASGGRGSPGRAVSEPHVSERATGTSSDILAAMARGVPKYFCEFP
jgi:transcriptional regulator with XRE-family HTH domain